MPVSDDLHGVIASEEPVALFLMDVEILRGVVVIHIPRHIKVHAAHGVHDLAHGIPFHHHLVVRLKAHQLGNLLIEVLNALLSFTVIIINRVDAFDIPRNIHHGIPGDGHDRSLLVGHIIACQEHGIRIPAAAGIPAQNQDGVIIFALPLTLGPGRGAFAVIDLLLLRIRSVAEVRADKQALAGHYDHQRHCQHNDHCQQHLFLPGQTALLSLFFFRYPIHQMLSTLSMHDKSILSASPAPQGSRGARGSPSLSFPQSSFPGPAAGPCPDPHNTLYAGYPPRENPGRVQCNPPDR